MLKGYLLIISGIIGMVFFGVYTFALYSRYNKKFKKNDFSRKLTDIKKEKNELVKKSSKLNKNLSLSLSSSNSSMKIKKLEDTTLIEFDDTDILSTEDTEILED